MMSGSLRRVLAGLTVLTSLTLAGPMAALAQDNVWRVSRMSGEAWVSAAGAQPAGLTPDIALRPGDSIRTGRNGRVLLARGAENMLISPNTAISLPPMGEAGRTTVIQQTGTVLLDVEKKNVQHFEVETPYLAAVVKGTRFRVTVAQGRANVSVERGQVQVSDFRSGQFALVLPGQLASVTPGRGANQKFSGLKLSGSGALGPVLQGQPQASRVAPLAVPRSGLGAPVGVRPQGDRPALRDAGLHEKPAARGDVITRGRDGALRLSSTIGEVKLDIGKATRGLVQDSTAAPGNGQGKANGFFTNTAPDERGNGNSAADASIAAPGSTLSGTGLSPVNAGQANANSARSVSVGSDLLQRGSSGEDEAGGDSSSNGNGNSSSNGNRYGYGVQSTLEKVKKLKK